jgi:phenylpropionate dioxygenase-like ring-hydroxylating dioxygenase large terminal subunit
MQFNIFLLLLTLPIISSFTILSKSILYKTKLMMNMENIHEFDSDTKYNLNWYVIGEAKKIVENRLYKKTIWNKNYLIWKKSGQYYAMDDACSHRGVALSKGRIINDNIMCPYHGYQFNNQGVLAVVPGLNFTNTPCQNIDTYKILESGGWLHMNTISNVFYKPKEYRVFEEPELNNNTFSNIKIKQNFRNYGRVVSENSLDVMHIGFVHTFGNRIQPAPITEVPPHPINDYPFHYKTAYTYKSGEDSIAKKIFNVKELKIENEFILPHTTIARVIFGDFISTVITSALPVNETFTELYVKTYRNFWRTTNDTNVISMFYNWIGDYITTEMMKNTVKQDMAVIESIPLDKVNGKFNMKFDKLQNAYVSFYRKFINKR